MSDTVQIVNCHPIVIDAETGMRVRDAKVLIDNAETATIWDGSFTIDKPYKMISISKKGYLTRHLNYGERMDTIVLVNNGHNLDEVVVIGHLPVPHIYFGPKQREIKETAPKPTGMDFLRAIDHVFNHKKYKRRAKVKQVLKEYSGGGEEEFSQNK